MKNSLTIASAIMATLLMINSGCQKEVLKADSPVVTPQPPPPVSSNTAPICNAGQDVSLSMPTNFCSLNGSAQDLENNIATILWRKIAGPTAFVINEPNSLSPKLDGLLNGVYQFELTVTDKMGLYGKDTIKVTFNGLPPVTKELIFENLPWIFPWYNSIEVKDFYNFFPPDSPFRVFINRGTNPTWIEVSPLTSSPASTVTYEYFVEARLDGGGIYTYGSLYIFYYGVDVSDSPNVKIVF